MKAKVRHNAFEMSNSCGIHIFIQKKKIGHNTWCTGSLCRYFRINLGKSMNSILKKKSKRRPTALFCQMFPCFT